MQLSIKRSKILKLIKKVNIFWLFWYKSNHFGLKLISLNFFDIIWTRFNWFPQDGLESDFKFGLKKLIKTWFVHDISWFGDLDQLLHLSLVLISFIQNHIHLMIICLFFLYKCLKNMLEGTNKLIETKLTYSWSIPNMFYLLFSSLYIFHHFSSY